MAGTIPPAISTHLQRGLCSIFCRCFLAEEIFEEAFHFEQ